METRADETPPGAVPLSGKVHEPGPVKKAFAVAANDPYDALITCAPRYTGLADQVLVCRSWEAVARKLSELGARRALYSSARGGSRAQLRTQVQDEIRQVWQEEADPLGIPVETIAQLLGVTRWAAYNILGERVGGKGKRGTDPAKPETE